MRNRKRNPPQNPKQQEIEGLVLNFLLSIQHLKESDPDLHNTYLTQLRRVLDQ